MSGAYFTQYQDRLEKSPQEVVDSLRDDLLSGNEERARTAAALVRSSYDIDDQYRRAGLGLVVMIDGKIQEVDPDSPLLPDLSPLIPIVKQLFPLPPEKEPPGFV